MGQGWRVAQSWRKEDLGEEEHGRVLAAATPKFSPREILGHKIPIIVSKKKSKQKQHFFFFMKDGNLLKQLLTSRQHHIKPV